MYIFIKLSLILYQTVAKHKLSVRLVYVQQEVRAVLTAFIGSGQSSTMGPLPTQPPTGIKL